MSTPVKITSKKIRNLFRAHWLEVGTLWITDKEYMVPNLKDVRKMISKVTVANLPHNESLNECEDYALLLMAAVRRYRIEFMDLIPEEEQLNWAFGICGLRKYRGLKYNHTVCFCVTNAGLYMFDAQFDDSGWKASGDQEDVYAIFM